MLSKKSGEENILPQLTGSRYETLNFSRAVPRRIPAEVLYDAIQLATMSNAKGDAYRGDRSQRHGRPVAAVDAVIATPNADDVDGLNTANATPTKDCCTRSAFSTLAMPTPRT